MISEAAQTVRFDPVSMPLSGVHSIAASAGTGKTYAITTLYLRYLLELGHPTDRILVTTFTEAATAELKDRLRKRIRDAFEIVRQCKTDEEAQLLVDLDKADAQIVAVLTTAGAWQEATAARIRDRLDDAKSNFDQAPVFTIHGFCSRVLQELVFETGTRFNTELVSSLDDLIEEAVCDFVARNWATDDSRIANWLKLDNGLFGELTRIASECLENPNAVVVPGDRDIDACLSSPALSGFETIVAELARDWSNERSEVEALLFKARDEQWLNMKSHGGANQIEKSLEFIDELIEIRSASLLKIDQKTDTLIAEQRRLSQSNLADKGMKKAFGHLAPRHRVFELLDDLVELAPQLVECQQGLRAALFAELADFVREHVERRKRERAVMSFSDLLREVDQALEGQQKDLLLQSLRERYHVALIDEFQDTDPVQYRIFSNVFQSAAADDALAATMAEAATPPLEVETEAFKFDASEVPSEPESDVEDDDEYQHEEDEEEDPADSFLANFYADSGSSTGSAMLTPGAAVTKPVTTEAPAITQPQFGRRAFVMIGDPKQSIYRFRGADIHAYLKATDDTPFSNRHEMGTNWRSDDSLVKTVQALFASVENPFLNKSIPLPDVSARFPDRLSGGPALRVTLVARPNQSEPDKPASAFAAFDQVVRQLTTDIIETLRSDQRIETADGSRPIEPSDIAVLCHKGVHLRKVQDALSDCGIPSVLQTDQSVYQTPEAEAMCHIMRAALNPGHPGRMACALATPVFGFRADQLDKLMRDDTDRLSDYVERFREWNEIWNRNGFMVMWRRVLDAQETLARLAGQITGLRQITNFLHLGELLHRQAITAHSGPDELMRWFEQTLSRDGSSRDDESMLRLETDAAAVQLCTIHRSKGLEYPIVFCPALWSSRTLTTPKYVLSRFGTGDNELTIPELDVGSDLLEDRINRQHQEEAAEERRLLYVALTRPRHQCHLYWIAAKESNRTALAQIMLKDPSGNETDNELRTKIADWVDQLEVSRAVSRFVTPPDAHSHRTSTPALHDSSSVAWTATTTAQSGAMSQSLASRPVTRPSLPTVLQTSFTALAASAAAHSTTSALLPSRDTTFEDLTDRDASSRFELEVLNDPGTTGPLPIEEQARHDTVLLAEMPGGRQVGTIVHDVLESLISRGDLYHPNERTIQDAVRRRLEPELPKAQLDATWLDPLASSLTRCVAGSIPQIDETCSLSGIPRERLVCEMPFLIRLGSPEARFTVEAVAAAFEQSQQPLMRQYAARIRRMNVHGLRGLLAGFIDLTFEWNERWYIVDYKTNQLGPRTSDYSHAKIEQAMVEHDYILQATLYCVALDQLLRQRVNSYDYQRDFGGVVYIFLRGLPQSSALDRGIYFDRPEESLITALASALTGRQ